MQRLNTRRGYGPTKKIEKISENALITDMCAPNIWR